MTQLLRVRSYLCIVIVFCLGSCATAEDADRFDGFDELLDARADAAGIPGYAFAVFDDSDILYQRVSGLKNAQSREAVDANTVFEAASISKPVFGYIMLSLAQSGVVDLDAPIGDSDVVMDQLGYDPRSTALTPRMLMTHRGGLPNWRTRINFDAENYEQLFGPTDTLQFVHDPGTQHNYSGEGYVLLQQLIEDTSGRSLNELAQEIVFDPLGMQRSSFKFDDLMRTNFSYGHNREGAPDKWEIAMELASSTLHTTAADLAAFGVHLASAIRGETYPAELAAPGPTIASQDGWTANWGPGLGIVADSAASYVYHGGNNVIFIADFIYGVEDNLGYVLLTNSANGREMVEAVEQRIYGKDIPRL